MAEPLLIAKGEEDLFLLPQMANRHAVIAGATGTGKTVTLQSLAQSLSDIGVPIFMADVKGDLAGMARAGGDNARVQQRLEQLGLTDRPFEACPTVFWDLFGEQGHPVRTTVSEMGPLLLARLLNLNETQAGVLTLTFKVADDHGLLLLDLKDLRAMVQHVGENAAEYKTTYGNISPASVGAIQRGLLALEEQEGDRFFGEPALNIEDLLQTDVSGKGVVNILAADKLLQSPKVYATFLLWLLSELYETLPEAGDLDKPKLVLFFDEAHLLFDDAPKALVDKVEQVVRLIRSKGVGVFFITQNPMDIPEKILGQLGNRVQHALRAFTQQDQKAVRAAATTFRANPKLNTEAAITELGVGEALVSLLNADGTPGVDQRAFIVPPGSHLGALTPEERQAVIDASPIAGYYEKAVDRESAFELLKAKSEQAAANREAEIDSRELERQEAAEAKRLAAEEKARAKAEAEAARIRARQTETVIRSATRIATSSVGREIVRGLLGGLFGGGGRRRR